MALRHRRRILLCTAIAGWAGTIGAAALVGGPSVLPRAAADPGPTVSPTVDPGQPTQQDQPANGELLWEADPAKGPAEVFQSLEEHTGSITVADDPKGQYGPSFKYVIGAEEGKDRCESKGHHVNGADLTFAEQGKVYYIGWRSLWDSMSVDGGWVAFWQMKHYGSGEGGGPLALRTTQDGMLHLQYDPPGDGDGEDDDGHIWSTDLKLGEWQSFVIGFQVSRDPAQPGWLEFWYNGQQQTFTNGQTRHEMLMKPDTDYVTDKWGVYRSGNVSGDGTAYLNAAKVGTSYQVVAPEQPSGTTPTVTTTPTPTATPTGSTTTESSDSG